MQGTWPGLCPESRHDCDREDPGNGPGPAAGNSMIGTMDSDPAAAAGHESPGAAVLPSESAAAELTRARQPEQNNRNPGPGWAARPGFKLL